MKIRVLFFVTILVLFGCSNENEENRYNVELVIKDNFSLIDVRYDNKTSRTLLFRDGREVEVLSYVPRISSEVMKLPHTKEEINIERKEPVSDLTWESNLEESSAYINYLISQGYEIVREIYSSDFIEIFLSKGESRKRLIIFTTVIMVGEMTDSVSLLEIENYINKFRVGGNDE